MITTESPRAEQPIGADIPLTYHQLAMIYRCRAIEDFQINNPINPPKLRTAASDILQNEAHYRKNDQISRNLDAGNMDISDPSKAKILIDQQGEAIINKFLVLGTKPGSGKSYVILSHILNEKLNNPENNYNNLLVVPSNLYSQWMEYIGRFSKNLSVLQIRTYNDIATICNNNFLEIYNYDIIIITSIMYTKFAHEAFGAEFINPDSNDPDNSLNASCMVHRVIFDEIDSLDNMVTERFTSNFTWFVSASFNPEKIGAYNTIFPFNHLSKLTCDCDPTFISNCFLIPDYNLNVYKCNDYYIDVPTALHDKIAEIDPKDETFIKIQNEVNTMKYSYKLSNVQHKSTNVCELLDSVLADKLAILVRKIEHIRSLKKQRKDKTSGTDTRGILLLDTSIAREVSIHEVDKKKVEVLIDYLPQKFITNCCSKNVPGMDSVSTRDIHNIYNTNRKSILCALCNGPLSVTLKTPEVYNKEISKMTSEPVLESIDSKTIIRSLDDIPENLTKYKCLTEILKLIKPNIANAKIIIFCDNGFAFRTFSNIIKENGFTMDSLDNHDTKSVHSTLSNFSTGRVQVLLIESNLFGCGLNLEYVTDMILMHNMYNVEQIIGRSQRLNRTFPLNVHHLAYGNELSSETAVKESQEDAEYQSIYVADNEKFFSSKEEEKVDLSDDFTSTFSQMLAQQNITGANKYAIGSEETGFNVSNIGSEESINSSSNITFLSDTIQQKTPLSLYDQIDNM